MRREVRIRFGQSGCGGGTAFADKNPDTFYAYTGNGDLQSVTYPHGRRVLYQHNFANGSGRVESIIAEVFNGLFTVSVMLVNEVAWEPYGALRAYRLAPSGMLVEYLLAGGLETDAVGSELSCALLQASGAPATDGSGRLRGLYVSGAGATLGAPDGQVMKQVYRWKGDMLEKQWTCHRNTAGLPQLMTYAHDGTQRLLSATAGGNGASEAFSFAGAEGRRGNRTRATSTFTGMDAPCTQDYFSLASTVGGQPHQQDLLDAVQWGWAHGGSTCNTGDMVATGRYDWDWDRDGRRTRLSDATGLYVVTTGYEQTRLGAGLDSVIHTATISGGSYHGGNYTYFYDAFGRRRAKRLPWWERGDEYFHDVSGQLLSDRGVNSIGSTPTEYPEVDYVWLGGRPVVAIQGKFAIDSRPEVESMVRQPDVLGDCTRNGQPQACGVKYIVTDYIGKPVLVLDRADAFEPKIAAVGSYTAFGYANRFPFFYGSRHYQAARRNPEGCEPLGLDCAAVSEPVASLSAGLPAPEGWDANVRVLLHRSQGTVAGFENRPFFTLNGALQSMGDWAHRWSGFVSSSSGDYTLDYVGNTASYGLDTEAVEIRVKESAAQWWFPNLRFPGQYFDEETELVSNGARFMDPSTGTFTGPEPFLQDPRFAALMAQQGLTTPTYAYAVNNPINYTDPDGRFVLPLIPLALKLGAAALAGAGIGFGLGFASTRWTPVGVPANEDRETLPPESVPKAPEPARFPTEQCKPPGEYCELQPQMMTPLMGAPITCIYKCPSDSKLLFQKIPAGGTCAPRVAR